MRVLKAIGVAVLTWFALGIVSIVVIPAISMLLGPTADPRALGGMASIGAMVVAVVVAVLFYRRNG